MSLVNGPLVSVVMAVFNGERYLHAALESALNQSYSHVEVIVVNDGSTDRSEKILDEYGNHIRVFSQSNVGQSSARNRGIEMARGTWIAFLDQDDIWDANKLDKQLGAAHAGDDIIFSASRLIDASGTCTNPHAGWPILEFTPCLRHFIIFNQIMMLSALVRRESLQNVGGLDPANRFGTDDYQLWLSLAATGHRFRYVDEVLSSYRLHGNNMSINKSRMYLGDVYALEKTWQRYQNAFKKRERYVYHKRLHELHFGLGWHAYKRKEFKSASQHFRKALHHHPSDSRSWFYIVATFILDHH
jgi:glycosyltransferase involved in cell wall biosynthesis